MPVYIYVHSQNLAAAGGAAWQDFLHTLVQGMPPTWRASAGVLHIQGRGEEVPFGHLEHELTTTVTRREENLMEEVSLSESGV